VKRFGALFLVTGGVLLGFGAIVVLWGADMLWMGPFFATAGPGVFLILVGAALLRYCRPDTKAMSFRRIEVYSLLVFLAVTVVPQFIAFSGLQQVKPRSEMTQSRRSWPP